MKWFKYRITTDGYSGYELQYKFILFPFWLPLMFVSFSTVERAEDYYNKEIMKKVIKELK